MGKVASGRCPAQSITRISYQRRLAGAAAGGAAVRGFDTIDVLDRRVRADTIPTIAAHPAETRHGISHALFRSGRFYSHADPKGKGDTHWRRWSLGLIEKLEHDFEQAAPDLQGVMIWRDEKGDQTLHLTEELHGKVSGACILIIVMTSYYLISDWCKDELGWFREQIDERSSLDQGRVFVIHAQPMKTDQWPDFLRDKRGHALRGFKFCASDALFPFGWPETLDKDEQFRTARLDLVTVLVHRLRKFKEHYGKRPAAPAHIMPQPEPAKGPCRVFLHAGRDHMAERDAIKSELERDGFVIVTLPPAAAAGDFGTQERKSRKLRLENCDALALVTGADAASDEDEFFEICVREREALAVERGGLMPCAMLERSGGRLRDDCKTWGVEHIDATQDGWRDKFRTWLDQVRAQAGGAP